MPNFGPLVTSGIIPIDAFAPGAGILSVFQDGKDIVFKFKLPVLDADGGSLTGITKVTVGIAPANPDGSNPFVDVATFSNVAVAIQEFNVDLTDEEIEGKFPVLQFGKMHYLAAFAEDGTDEESTFEDENNSEPTEEEPFNDYSSSNEETDPLDPPTSKTTN